jgi:predicted ribosomally synthesized peptide with SipW-like signal peptide
MLNKKMILSILTIGMFATIAAAGTWAYFQDTVTSYGNNISTGNLSSIYSLDDGSTWTKFYDDQGDTFGPFNVSNVIPGQSGTVQSILIGNNGTTNSTVNVTATEALGSVDVPDLLIYVGDPAQLIYDGTGFLGPVNLGDLAPNGTPINASITYVYTDTGGYQNDQENTTVSFDLVVSERAIV